MQGSEFEDLRLRLRVLGFGTRGLKVKDPGFMLRNLKFKVQILRFRV